MLVGSLVLSSGIAVLQEWLYSRLKTYILLCYAKFALTIEFQTAICIESSAVLPISISKYDRNILYG